MKQYRARTWQWTISDEIVEWLNQMAQEGFEFIASGGGTFIVGRDVEEIRPEKQFWTQAVVERAREFVNWPTNTNEVAMRVGGRKLIEAIEALDQVR